MADLKQRAAELNDLKGIWGLLRQTANDIPFDIESEANQENILTELMACCTSGLSPIFSMRTKRLSVRCLCGGMISSGDLER